MRVLVTTYPTAFLNKGGGEIHLLDMTTHLKNAGIQVDIYGHTSKHIREYDLVHHFSVQGGSEYILAAARDCGKKIIITPLIWLDENSRYDINLIKTILAYADLVVTNSEMESRQLIRHLGMNPGLLRHVHVGVDPCFFEKADPCLFKTVYNVQDYILSVGMIEERKNTLNIVRALRDIGRPVVFVGDYRDKKYYDACMREANGFPNVKFVPYLSPKSEILRSAYQNCLLYVQASLLDTPGISALEAAASGCKLVLATGGSVREYFENYCEFIEPNTPDGIKRAVSKALASSHDRSKAVAYIKDNYFWPNVAKRLVNVYEDLLKR